MANEMFDFLPFNRRPGKPRDTGMTEIRGPYYTPMGKRYLADILETVGAYVDGLKYSGGSFALMPAEAVKQITELAHDNNVYVSTGGWVEHVLTQGESAVDRYIDAVKALGFDIVELSVGFVSLPTDDLLKLIEKVRAAGLTPKPELGIQFGAGGDSPTAELEAEGTRNAGWVISRARRCFDAGAEMIHVESEGITENISTWRTDIVEQIIDAVGLERVMFEAADPPVFEWYIKNYGNDVNLFVDHSQIVQLECLRSGLWGTNSTFGRIVTLR